MCCRFELLGTLLLFVQGLHDRHAQKRATRAPAPSKPLTRRPKPADDPLHHQSHHPPTPT